MQLTKDDIFKGDNLSKSCFPEDVIPLSKFQQVVEFYEKYRDEIFKFYDDNSEDINVCILWEEHCAKPITNKEFNDWLFHYCFKDGLREETIDDHPIITPDICKKITMDGLK